MEPSDISLFISKIALAECIVQLTQIGILGGGGGGGGAALAASDLRPAPAYLLVNYVPVQRHCCILGEGGTAKKFNCLEVQTIHLHWHTLLGTRKQ